MNEIRGVISRLAEWIKACFQKILLSSLKLLQFLSSTLHGDKPAVCVTTVES